jgi:hypothetical protein
MNISRVNPLKNYALINNIMYIYMMLIMLCACEDRQVSTQDSVESSTDMQIFQDQMPTQTRDLYIRDTFLQMDQSESLIDMESDQQANIEADMQIDMGIILPVNPVNIDFTLFPENEDGYVRAFRSETETDLLVSQTRLGKIGDYVLENDNVRFVIEDDDRVIGPCPYGGNVIDASPRMLEQGDQIGELCLLINISQTLKPERYDIIEDGSQGRAILAVTGHLELLDFINIKGFATAFLPSSLQLGFDTETLLPLAITIYYILTPNATGIRVLTALRNDGSEAVHFPIGHLIDSGGEVTTFSPYNAGESFGSPNVSPNDIAQGPSLFVLGFQGLGGSYLYAPDGFADLRSNRPFPIAGTYLTISGVSVSLLGTQNILATLLTAPGALPTAPGFQHLQPQEQSIIAHWHWVGNRNLASVLDPLWSHMQQQERMELTRIRGIVHVFNVTDDTVLTPLSQVRVTAIDDRDQTMNQAITDENGYFSFQIPRQNNYQIRAWRAGYGTQTLNLGDAEEESDLNLVLSPSAHIAVQVQDSQGQPVPAKVTFMCDPAPCTDQSIRNEFDTDQDYWTSGIAHVTLLDMSGYAEVNLNPGRYKVVASRGPTWSVWPDIQGVSLDLVAGENPRIEAIIDEVVDRSGWISGDFHVHGINSPDAPVSLTRRVLSFLAEGVDVLVSTDHDYITDYTPTIEALSAQSHLATIIGEELTTFDYGHYNAFPLIHDSNSRNGGAWDWAGGTDLCLPPSAIFEWLHSHPGEQVVAVNHAAGGYFSGMNIDVLRGTSKRQAQSSRLAEMAGSSDDDTGFWSEDFTAMEIYNGYNLESFNKLFRAWLTLVGRGFTPTATAVSDTHKVYRTLAGAPRSWVYVGADALSTNNDLSSLNHETFVAAINQGKLVGSNGPILKVSAHYNDQSASIGETLDLNGSDFDIAETSVQIKIEVRCPDWMSMDSAHIYVNIKEGLDLGPGNFDNTAVPATQSMVLQRVGEEAENGPRHSKEHVYQAIFEISITEDTYIVTTVAGTSSGYPVMRYTNVTPFAYSNPIYIDADGEGYNHYPLQDLIDQLDQSDESNQSDKIDGDYLPSSKLLSPLWKNLYQCPRDHFMEYDWSLKCLFSTESPYIIPSPRPDENAIRHLLHYLKDEH